MKNKSGLLNRLVNALHTDPKTDISEKSRRLLPTSAAVVVLYGQTRQTIPEKR